MDIRYYVIYKYIENDFFRKLSFYCCPICTTKTNDAYDKLRILICYS